MESDLFQKRAIGGAIAALLAVSSFPALAKDYVVQMKNKGADGMMVFEPAFVKAAPGDTIRFVPTDPGHNAETLPTILPTGAATMKGAMSKEIAMKVTTPGLYGIKCMPHYTMGMVALIEVGKPTPAQISAAKAVKLPPMAAKRMTALLAKVK